MCLSNQRKKRNFLFTVQAYCNRSRADLLSESHDLQEEFLFCRKYRV